MIIIGIDFTPSFSKLLWWIETPETFRKKTGASRGGRAVLPCSGGCTPESAGRNGGQRACTLVRTVADRVAVELWIGDAAEIRTRRVRRQKTDRQDARLILQLLLEDRFPKIWVPNVTE